MRVSTVVVGVLATLLTGGAVVQAASMSEGGSARSNLTIIAPAAVGGGWDGFARTAQQALRSEGIVNNVKVVNIPGAGGTIGLSQFVQMEGEESTIMVSGGVMVGAIELNGTPESLDDVIPLARLADDFSALVVPADSPFQNLDEFIEAWKANPRGISFAGGSLGSIDHLVTGRLAQEIGIDPSDANYIAYAGGGEALNSLLSHTTDAGVSGYNELADQLEAGTLRALAVSAPERIEGSDVPTFVEQGVDLTMSNWRGLVAAPGISPEAEAELREIVKEMHESEAWQEAVSRNSWTDSYMVGDDLTDYIADEIDIVTEIIDELGL